jgi:selenide,water dikinase
MGPGDLEKVMTRIPRKARSKRVLAGLDVLDDAGVYLVRKDLALVHTVDFFTPIVDDPYDYGSIAAANALSDIYAMGGTPVSALSIVCFPSDEMDLDILRSMLMGGLDKLREAGTELLGGHSVRDREMKFGFAVTGTVDPGRILLKSGARPGDALVLTKPLGIGVMSTALRAGRLPSRWETAITKQMTRLNRSSSAAVVRAGVSACTDVTGFGLLGHAYEMAQSSNRTLKIDSAAVPLLDPVLRLIRDGVFPGGLTSVREFLSGKMRVGKGVADELVYAMCDPQTSGGLLVSVPAVKAARLVRSIRGKGDTAEMIGEVVRRERLPLVVY